MKPIFNLYLFVFIGYSALAQAECVDSVKKLPGKRSVEVMCYKLNGETLKIVCEKRSGKNHGKCEDFHSNGKVSSVVFYRNGKKEDTAKVYDTSGNVISYGRYVNDKHFGKWVIGHSATQPREIKYYNQNGHVEGVWDEWYENGNKKSEFIARDDQVIRGVEYYPDGSPRVRYFAPNSPEAKTPSHIKYAEKEEWAPNGKSSGKLTNGSGTLISFSNELDSTTGNYFAWRETFKDSLLIELKPLDSAAIAPWLK